MHRQDTPDVMPLPYKGTRASRVRPILAWLTARLRFAAIRSREEGPVWTVKALLSRAWKIPVSLLALPVTIPLHVAGFRRLPVITQRIGHLTAEIDCFLKEQRMGQLPHRHWFVLAPKRRVANDVLLDYWRSYVRVVTHPAVCTKVEAPTRWGAMVEGR